MYHYIQDKDFRKRLKGTCSYIVNQLVMLYHSDRYYWNEIPDAGYCTNQRR
mgnify:CR=1 FL=1